MSESEKYKVRVWCKNCGDGLKLILIDKGFLVSSARCDKCDCQTLQRA